jgi:HAD superfamily hydrolase (TIGR01509 family)
LQEETDEIFPELLRRKLAPLPGLLPMLDVLENVSMPKAVATSSRRQYASNILNSFDLESRFAFILTSESVKEGKPHPEIYLTAATRLGLEPSETVVFEDSEIGCRSAVAAGAAVVAIPGEHSRHHDFSGVRFVANSLEDPRIFALLGLDKFRASCDSANQGN